MGIKSFSGLLGQLIQGQRTEDVLIGTVVNCSKGVSDTVVGIVETPDRAIQYISGHTGGYEEHVSWSQKRSGFESWYDPAVRVMDTANYWFYGTVNTVLFGLPHKVTNEWGGLNIKYFSPGPRNAREFCQFGTGAIIVLSAPPISITRYDPLPPKVLIPEPRQWVDYLCWSLFEDQNRQWKFYNVWLVRIMGLRQQIVE